MSVTAATPGYQLIWDDLDPRTRQRVLQQVTGTAQAVLFLHCCITATLNKVIKLRILTPDGNTITEANLKLQLQQAKRNATSAEVP